MEISLAPPSLSQVPLSMHCLTQPSTSTLSQGNVTVLAPDTELNTQESILSKSSSLRPHCSDTTLTESGINVVDITKLMSLNSSKTPVKETNSSSTFTEHVQCKETKSDKTSIFEIKNEPSETPENISPAVDPSLGEVAVQSVESNQSFKDTTIFAPSSLTPGTRSKPSSSSSSSLPGVSLMAELFQNRRKRGMDAFSDAVSEEIEESQNSSVKKLKTEVNESVDVNDGRLFAGLRSSRSQTLQTGVSSHDPVIKNNNKFQAKFENEIEMDLASSPPSIAERMKPQVGPAKSDHQNQMLLEESSINVQGSSREGPIATSTQAGSKGFVSKILVSPVRADSAFISSRKRNQSCLTNNSTSEHSFTEQATNQDASQGDSVPIDTQIMQNSIKNMVAKGLFTPFTTPFTSLVSNRQEVAPASIFAATKGRRSTAPREIATDNLWIEDGAEENGVPVDGENPLGTQFDNPNSAKFKPVLTEDGFIKARTKPRLQVSCPTRSVLVAVSLCTVHPVVPSVTSQGPSLKCSKWC